MSGASVDTVATGSDWHERAREELLNRARGPLGPSIRPDFGTGDGPLGELAELLARQNGFAAFNAGLQVFHTGPRGLGPELTYWNHPDVWKDTCTGLADGLFCFAQDLAEPDVRGAHRFATAWQDVHGPLEHHQRLIPWRFIALGGDYSFDNLVAKDAIECMRIRGPVAQQVRGLPAGASVRLFVS